MADRYWVGGTAAWDGTAGTKWSATSGGAGGASVPTTADDVFFDANSTGTVTIASGNTGAKSINCTGFTGTIAGTAAISVAGGVTLVAGMTYTHTGTITFTGTGTLTTAGKTFSGVTVDGVGITLTLGDALNLATRQLSVTNGVFDTANYSVTAGGIASTTTSARTITLGSSTLSLSASINFNVSTNLTLNAGTSQINTSSNSAAILTSGGLTFYNVSFTGTGAGTREITGAATFNNLTLNASAVGLSQLSIAANQTVNGTFTCAGSSATARGFVRSDVIGTARTITAATLSANDCDFRDITIAGGAAGTAPTRAGDAGGNSGITFPAPKTVYWNLAGSQNWSANGWASSSGGTPASSNFPLAQDTAVIDESSAGTGLFFVQSNVGAVDASLRTSAFTLGVTSSPTIHGSCTLGSGITVSGSTEVTFSGRGTMVFTSAGKTITYPITVNAPGGTFQLGDAYSSSSSITHTRGTFDANDYNVTASPFTSSNSNTRTITMGSGLWTLSGTGTVWDLATTTNLTFNKDTANILLSSTTTAGRTFAGGGLSYNKLTIGGATGTSTCAITGTNSFTELASTKTVAHTVRFAANQGTIDTWSITGTAGNVVTFEGFAAGTRRTFNLTNVTSGIDYLSVKDIGVNQANRFYVGTNSTNGGNNTNVIFTAAPSGSVSVNVTGVEAVGAVGIGTVVASARAPPTGVEASGTVGTASVALPTQFSVTGVEASGTVGTVVVSIPKQISVTGLSAANDIGTVTVESDRQVSVTGVEAVGSLANTQETGVANVTLAGVEATGAVGTATTQSAYYLTGVSSSGAVGTVAVASKANVFAVGVTANAILSRVSVWGQVDDNQSANWVPVDGSQSTTWSAINDGNTVVWTQIPT